VDSQFASELLEERERSASHGDVLHEMHLLIRALHRCGVRKSRSSGREAVFVDESAEIDLFVEAFEEVMRWARAGFQLLGRAVRG
jgi:hypothetical protein